MSVNHDAIEFSMVRSPVWQGTIQPLTVDDDGEMNDSSWQKQVLPDWRSMPALCPKRP